MSVYGLVIFGICLVTYLYYVGTSRGRAKFVRIYGNEALPVIVRGMLTVLPLYGTAGLLMFGSQALPPPANLVSIASSFGMVLVAAGLSYRHEPFLLPGRLAEALRANQLPHFRPGRADWFILWGLAAIVAMAAAALCFLIAVGVRGTVP